MTKKNFTLLFATSPYELTTQLTLPATLITTFRHGSIVHTSPPHNLTCGYVRQSRVFASASPRTRGTSISRYQHHLPTRTRLTRTHLDQEIQTTPRPHKPLRTSSISLHPPPHMVGTSVMLFRRIHNPPPIQHRSRLMTTVNNSPPARQSHIRTSTTKASTRLRHLLAHYTPRRFKPSTTRPTHTPVTPLHSHTSITFSMIRHSAPATSSTPTCYVATSTINLTIYTLTSAATSTNSLPS